MMSAKKLPLGAAIKKYRNQYLMVAPFAIVFILFTVLPVAAAIFLSFTSFNMTSMPDWSAWRTTSPSSLRTTCSSPPSRIPWCSLS